MSRISQYIGNTNVIARFWVRQLHVAVLVNKSWKLEFLLLARYVPNVAKRRIWDQCKKYILTTDRPATDRGPTDDQPLNFENFKRPYFRKRSSDPLHVWFYSGVFEVGGSNGAISGFAKSKMAAGPHSWKVQMAISSRRIIQFTPCLVLGWGFRVGPSNGANSGLNKFNRYVGENNVRGVIRLVTIRSISCMQCISLLQCPLKTVIL